MMDVLNYDKTVDSWIQDGLSTLPPGAQDAAARTMGLSEPSSVRDSLPRRMIGAVVLAGGADDQSGGLAELGKIAAGFEIQWALDRLRTGTWCGANGMVLSPITNDLDATQTRVLGSMLQSLSSSLVASYEGSAEYLLAVAARVESAALALSEARYRLESLDVGPSPNAVVSLLRKRSEVFGFAALSSHILFEARLSEAALSSAEKFGMSLGVGYQLWTQLRFVSEMEERRLLGTDHPAVQECLSAYPVASVLVAKPHENRGAVVPSLEGIDLAWGYRLTQRYISRSLKAARAALEDTDIPSQLVSSWANLISQLSKAV